MNRLHPIYHGTSCQPGSRIGVERLLPNSPKDIDSEQLLDILSEPPQFIERTAPVRTQIGDELVRGRNWTDLMIKSLRVYGRMWSRLTMFAQPLMRDTFKEKGMVPFLSICVEPDTFHRIIELDYEAGENTYGSIMQLFAKGVLSPCATVPFGLMLPLLDSEFDRRMAIRIGLNFYSRIVDLYYQFIKKVHRESQFVLPFWLPEGAFSEDSLRILYEEFVAYYKGRNYPKPHLVLLLDNVQVKDRDNDILMKSWNVAPVGSNNGNVSVVFRDKGFSDWVSYSNPSVKKLLDRTIAKMDSALNTQDVNYGWGHFEDLEALTFSPKSVVNFEQKILKLVELGYLPVSPDVYVRRKLSGKFGVAKHEPRKIQVADISAGRAWDEESISLARWLGYGANNGSKPKVAPPRPYVRLTKAGEVREPGNQCWKIGYHEMRRRAFQAVRGNPVNFKGGLLEELAALCPARTEATVRRNVEAFLQDYSYIYWREHFIQHELSEADINIVEILRESLFKSARSKPTTLQCSVAAAAAQAYYFGLDSFKSADTRQVNFDQRAVYQNTMMLTMSVCNMVYVYRWLRKKTKEAGMIQLLKQEMMDFAGAYRRFRLSQFGVAEKDWKEAIASHVEDSDMNCVARATRRTAALRLRPLGYRREFTRRDEEMTTNVGHIWDQEVHNPNYRWENHLYCGHLEE